MTRLSCSEVRDLLHPYHDGELSPDERRTVGAHLDGCESCRDALRHVETLSARIAAAGDVSMPAGLRDRIAARMTDERSPARERRRHLLRLAASHAAALAVGAAAMALILGSGTVDKRPAVARDAIAAHVRGIGGERRVEVASADTHTVRPWFAGRLAFSPPVRNLAQHGFPLIGGRVDHLDAKPVAALVYERRKHVITVFVQPAEQAAGVAEGVTQHNGFSVVAWREGPFLAIAASDLNPGELAEFARLARGG